MNQSQHLQLMISSINSAGLNNKSKKDLQDIAQSLGIGDKLKKKEIESEIAKKLLQIFYKQQQQQFTELEIKQLNETFQKHNYLLQIMNTFSDQLQKAQIQQVQQQGYYGVQQNPNQQYQQFQNPQNQYYQQSVPQQQQYYYIQNGMVNPNLAQYQQYYQQQYGQPMPNQQLQYAQAYQNNPQVQQMGGYMNQQGSNQTLEKCLCQIFPQLRGKANDNQVIKCINKECGKEYHMACLKCPSNNVEFIKNFECFNCILKKYDPLHKVKEEIIPPVSLKLSSSNQPNQFHFILNENQFKLLQDKSHNLEIRCIRVDIKHLYETTWPDFGEMKLNDQLLYDFKPLQMNSSLKKRKDEKYTIRDLQYLKMGENQLYIKEFTGNKEQKENFRIQEHIHIIAMYIVQKISCEKLTKEVKETSIKNEEECKQLIKKQFVESKDEVSIDKLSVSLNCNFDMQMMKTPAKGRWCKHLQCFSLENFIMITESTVPRKWKCPYCKQKCYDLLVDQYMLNIINECRAKQLQVSDVTFDEKANYKLEEEQFSDSEEQKQPTQAPKVENKDSKKESETQQNSSNTNTKNQNQQQNQVIILDSEDEDNNPAQQQNQYLNTNGIIPNGNEAMDLEERQQSLATVPTNVDMEEGPFQLLKLKEPEENKKIRNQFVTSIKESQFFYEDCDFEKFEEENYEESKHEFNSDKIVEISNHKITKNVKKQYPEIFSVLKKDQVIPIQNNPAYYQELQRANSFNYQNHFGDKTSQEDYAHFYSSPYPPLPPVFQGQKPFGYYSIQQFQTHPSLYPPQKYPQKKVQVQGASNEASSNLATSNQTNNNNNNNNNNIENNNNNNSNNNVNNQKQNEPKNKIVEETNIPFGKKDDPICIDD